MWGLWLSSPIGTLTCGGLHIYKLWTSLQSLDLDHPSPGGPHIPSVRTGIHPPGGTSHPIKLKLLDHPDPGGPHIPSVRTGIQPTRQDFTSH